MAELPADYRKCFFECSICRRPLAVDDNEKVVAVALHNEDDEERNSELNSSEDSDE